jgi:protein-S-isoprenylcysteine O-methyltransferase Ste14
VPWRPRLRELRLVLRAAGAGDRLMVGWAGGQCRCATAVPAAAAAGVMSYAALYCALRLRPHPMVIAGLGQGLAMALWFGSWAVLAYVLTGGAPWQLLVRPAEERDLHATYGDGFTRYCAHVAGWVPRSRPYTGIRET